MLARFHSPIRPLNLRRIIVLELLATLLMQMPSLFGPTDGNNLDTSATSLLPASPYGPTVGNNLDTSATSVAGAAADTERASGSAAAAASSSQPRSVTPLLGTGTGGGGVIGAQTAHSTHSPRPTTGRRRIESRRQVALSGAAGSIGSHLRPRQSASICEYLALPSRRRSSAGAGGCCNFWAPCSSLCAGHWAAINDKTIDIVF